MRYLDALRQLDDMTRDLIVLDEADLRQAIPNPEEMLGALVCVEVGLKILRQNLGLTDIRSVTRSDVRIVTSSDSAGG